MRRLLILGLLAITACTDPSPGGYDPASAVAIPLPGWEPGPRSLLLDDDGALFLVDAGQIARVDRRTGDLEPLATVESQYLGVPAIDADHIYVIASPASQILRVPKAGGAPEPLLTSASPASLVELAVAGGFVWARSQARFRPHTIFKVPVSGGSLVPAFTADGLGFNAMLGSRRDLYFSRIDDPALYSSGTPPRYDLPVDGFEIEVGALAAGAAGVSWRADRFNGDDTYTSVFGRLPFGGAPEALVSVDYSVSDPADLGPRGEALAASSLGFYWPDLVAPAIRVLRDGASADEVLLETDGSVHQVVADEHGLAWTTIKGLPEGGTIDTLHLLPRK